MFKNEYNSSFDNISPDNNLKQEILEKITVTKTKKQHKKTVYFARSAFAIAAAFAVVLSVWTINKNTDKFDVLNKEQTETADEVFNSPDNYKDVFKKLKKFKNEYKYSLYNDVVDEGIIYEADTEDVATGVDDNFSASAKPGGSSSGLKGSSSQNNKTDANTATNGGTQLKGESESTQNKDYSSTNTQVAEVDEADVVKTDGEYIYILSRKYEKEVSVELKIVKAGQKPELISTTCVNTDSFYPGDEMYICDGKLVITGTSTDNYIMKSYTKADTISGRCMVAVYDVSSPQEVKRLYLLEQSGHYSSSRMINDTLYLITEYSVNTEIIDEKQPETYIPQVVAENINGCISEKCIIINDEINTARYSVISGYNIPKGELVSNYSFLGGTDHIYCSTNNIITANFRSYDSKDSTDLYRFAIDNGKIEYKADGKVEGYLHNQFSIDEYNGYFRFVTTSTEYTETEHVKISTTTYNHLFVFDGNLKQVGAIKNLAPDENVKSARFMGDTAFFVTFREVDPLFSVDLSNPQNPKILGELKIPGFSDYLYPLGEGKLLGVGREQPENSRTFNVKLSLFDIADPANVTEYAKYITDSQHSEALYNHKATFVDAERQLVGFVGTSYFNDYSSEYFIYGIENGKFTVKYRVSLDKLRYTEYMRGLYIGDYFYIVSPDFIQVVDYNTFADVSRIELNSDTDSYQVKP